MVERGGPGDLPGRPRGRLGRGRQLGQLLLASATDRHPAGLANGSGQVGRNYMFHNSVAVLAISKEPNPTSSRRRWLNDFYFGKPGFEFPMGNIQMVGKSDAEMFKGEKPLETKLAPMFSLTEVATHSVDFWLSTEDLPGPDNRVTLTRPATQAQLHTEQTGAQGAAVRPAEVDARAPGDAPDHLMARKVYLKNDIPIGGCARQAGTVRFGPTRRPRSSTELQGPRARQPVRGRHQLLPEHRRGEPGADRHRQRAASRRPPARRLGAASGRETVGVWARAPLTRRTPNAAAAAWGILLFTGVRGPKPVSA